MFLDIKILWIFFWCHHKIGLYLGIISMHYRVFSYGQGTEWGYFFFFLGGGGVLYFEIFLGVLEIPDIFFFLGGGGER